MAVGHFQGEVVYKFEKISNNTGAVNALVLFCFNLVILCRK